MTCVCVCVCVCVWILSADLSRLADELPAILDTFRPDLVLL